MGFLGMVASWQQAQAGKGKRKADEGGGWEMPTVRVVLRHPAEGEQAKIYHDVEAHISTNNVLRITRGGADSIAEFQAEAYLYWEYEEDPAAQS